MAFANFEFVRWALLASIAIYFVFAFFDSQQVKDEREELIRLKTFELVHRATTSALMVISFVYFCLPSLNAIYPMFMMVLAFLYTEIFGKIYFRRKF